MKKIAKIKVTCVDCRGSGVVSNYESDGSGGYERCETCKGRGWVWSGYLWRSMLKIKNK
jgi:DnaJ-class molecular chaperone